MLYDGVAAEQQVRLHNADELRAFRGCEMRGHKARVFPLLESIERRLSIRQAARFAQPSERGFDDAAVVVLGDQRAEAESIAKIPLDRVEVLCHLRPCPLGFSGKADK
jgi:hypothetical protein